VRSKAIGLTEAEAAGAKRSAMTPRDRHLSRREARSKTTCVRLPNGATFGGEVLALCAGPCSVESEAQIEATAAAVAHAGANVLRGGAFKPRTSPYAFQGLGRHGLAMLRGAADRHAMAVVTEVLDPRDVAMVAEYADMLQIGSRNMQNFALLREAGLAGKPVLLKRGFAATIDEWLMAAEYVLVEGNSQVVLCERGVRSFDPATRNLLDLSAVPLLAELTHLPVVVDPSHGTGLARLVEPMSLAAIAAGADGLLVEVHPEPADAASDGPQSLTFEQFASLTARLTDVATAVGRRVPSVELTASRS
jgi:3-deoxy-7-phosphoheptulonate synthase